MRTSYDTDVLIFGGGPSGSLVAALLRRQRPELRVTIVERASFPRHHVGEACLPGWSSILARAGILDQAHAQAEVHKIGFIFNWGPGGDSTWTADFRDEAGGVPVGSWHVDRARMDTLFLNHAGQLGAEVIQPATVRDVQPLRGPSPPPKDGESPGFQVEIDTSAGRRSLTAHTIVDASGSARVLVHRWKLPLHQHEDMNNFAIYGYWRGGEVEKGGGSLSGRQRWAVVSSTELGWMWHIPIGLDLVSVGLVTHADTVAALGKRALQDTYLDAAKNTFRIGELLTGAEFIGDRPDGGAHRVNTVADWSYRCDNVCGAGWFVVGDGAIFVDPILSSGLTLSSTGASMVANAICTLDAEDTVDRALLRQSFQDAYVDISSAYHRMARVWYRRNKRSSWHWQARQERLRTAGAGALFEEDADAFTAVCLGVLNSPLNAALPRYSQEVWGVEYFTWMTNDRLFGRAGHDDQGRSEAKGLYEARIRSRRSLMQRWQRLIDARLRLSSEWKVCRGYHTNRFMDRWHTIPYVSIDLNDPLDPHLRIAAPAFADHPSGVFPALNGAHPLREALTRLLTPYARGSSAREQRLKAFSESILQLDMLGLLQVSEAPSSPSLQGHPLLTVVANVALRALSFPANLYVEVDWLGESVWLRVMRDGELCTARLYDVEGMAQDRGLVHTATTAVEWARRDGHWMMSYIDRLVRRLRVLEQGPRKGEVRTYWQRVRELAGHGIGFEHTLGEDPVPLRL